jgi:hypothetical protein
MRRKPPRRALGIRLAKRCRSCMRPLMIACSVSIQSRSGTHGASVPHRKAINVKVTIDSQEPLADALRIIGALYDVTLQVAGPQPDKAQEVPARARSATSKTAKKASVAKKATGPKSARGANGASRTTNADLRSWARAHGLPVSARGRVPAAITAAYNAEND